MKKIRLLSLALSLLLLLTACGGGAPEPSPEDSPAPPTQEDTATSMTAICTNGHFTGQPEPETGVLSFKGIPYAKAPVGELRWKAPQAPEASGETFQAADFGKSCLQYEWPSEPASYNEIGEDCLTLNIWTKDLTTDGKPVMVYFHGGSYAWGGTSDPLYNGQYFVDRNEDIIIVTANYRIGMMGFVDFSHVEGGEDFPDAPVLGLLDQIQALKWVQENITAFGGDPNNVTIFGESAGAGSTSLLLVIDEAKGLFQKCIAQSGNLSMTCTQEELDEGGMTEILLELTGAQNMDDLMAIPEEELIEYYLTPLDEDETCLNDLYNPPLRGGSLIPEDPYQALLDGASKDVIFLTGTNSNEWNYWIEEMGMENMQEGAAVYEASIIDPMLEFVRTSATAEENALVDQFLALQADKEPLWAKTEFCNDLAFRVPAITAVTNHTKAGGVSYLYYFAKDSGLEMLGACHASEVAYVFHNLRDDLLFGTAEPGLADQISDAWANFARTGDPSTETNPWAPYTVENRETMVVGNDCTMRMENDWMGQERTLIEPLIKYVRMGNV